MSAPRPIAVVLDGPPTPAWQALALGNVEDSPAVEVVETRLLAPARRPWARRLRAAAERHLFGLGADPFAPRQVAPYGPTGRAAELVVWLAEHPPPAGKQPASISLRHRGVAGPAEEAFRRALLEGSSWVESEIVLLRGDAVAVLRRTVSAVRPFSVTLSYTLALWKLAALLPRTLARLDETAATSEATLPTTTWGEATPQTTTRGGAAPPAIPAGSAGALWPRVIASWMRVIAVRLLFRRPWSIRVRRRSTAPGKSWEDDEGLVHWGDARMYADPFLFEHDGRHHLFCEEVPRNGKKGVISHTELPADGSPATPPKPVLRADCHLSYPFVFAYQGEVFMVPETSALRRVELYRAIEFPSVWEREATLLEDVDAADATLLEHDGRIWLFASVAAPGASSLDELYLFWAEELRGPWHSHPLNPVVSDVRGARPAGAIQRWGEKLVRPAQDGSRRYGWAISFRQIDVLTPTRYAEHEVERLEPAAVERGRAIHTYTADGPFEAIDIRRRELRLRLSRNRA